ncbi:MAG: CHRD domain-containing protein [Chitinophagaceae bacterium]
MKKTFDRSITWIVSLSLLFVLAIAPACKKDKNNKDPNAYTLAANASGAQEFPANAATATGTLTGTYNSSTNKLVYNISWSGLTGIPSGLHFHGPALPGVNAGILISLTITTAAAAGGASGEAVLTEAQETDMLGGKWYWNVHTAAFPGGEIRGQVIATQ